MSVAWRMPGRQWCTPRTRCGSSRTWAHRWPCSPPAGSAGTAVPSRSSTPGEAARSLPTARYSGHRWKGHTGASCRHSTRECWPGRSTPMLGNSLAVAALDQRILRRDPAPVLVMTVVPLLFVPFLMPGARAQLVDLGHPHATGAEYAVPGLAILFSLLNAQQVITGFFRESDWGTWHRLRIAPVSFSGLVVGKSLTALAAQLLQLVVVLVGGGLLFGYRPNGSVPGLLVIAVLFSTTMVCFGMFLFALCRTENQALTLSNIVAMAMAGFGGTFGPVAALPVWVQPVSPASPA